MKLTVQPLKTRDPGSGMAVIDRTVLQELDVSSGDFVAVEGPSGNRIVARVWPSDSEDAGRGIIRIDGQLREAAGVSVDDPVRVEPTAVESAERVTVALPQSLRVRGDLGSYLREELAGQAVKAGQTVAVPIGFGLFSGRSDRRVPLQIVETNPGGTVVIETDTDSTAFADEGERFRGVRGWLRELAATVSTISAARARARRCSCGPSRL